MPCILPISDLQNNVLGIAELAHNEQQPVYITRNGYADFVIMSVETYERQLARLEVYEKFAQAQAQVDSGMPMKTVDDMQSVITHQCFSAK